MCVQSEAPLLHYYTIHSAGKSRTVQMAPNVERHSDVASQLMAFPFIGSFRFVIL